MFCGECGTKNPDTGEMCSGCGKPLKSRPVMQPGTAAAPVPETIPSPGVAVPAGKQKRNWAGIAGIICGVLSWGILTTFLALAAIILGGYSLYTVHKETGKVTYCAIAGIIIAGAALAVNTIIR